MQPSFSNPQSDQFSFITNPTPKKPALLGGDPFIKRIAIIIGGAIGFMLVVWLVFSLLPGGKTTKIDLLSLAETQQELVRVATLGNASAVQQDTKNMASNVLYTLQTQETATLGRLSKQGQKVSDKQLSLKQDATADQKLSVAKETSTFDTTFSALIQQDLQSYAATVKSLSTTATKQQDVDLYSNYYQQTQLLISQINTSQQGTL